MGKYKKNKIYTMANVHEANVTTKWTETVSNDAGLKGNIGKIQKSFKEQKIPVQTAPEGRKRKKAAPVFL